MNIRKILALAFVAVCMASARASAAVDSTAFVNLRTDATTFVGYALGAVVVVISAILGIKGLVFAYNRIAARMGRS